MFYLSNSKLDCIGICELHIASSEFRLLAIRLTQVFQADTQAAQRLVPASSLLYLTGGKERAREGFGNF